MGECRVTGNTGSRNALPPSVDTGSLHALRAHAHDTWSACPHGDFIENVLHRIDTRLATSAYTLLRLYLPGLCPFSPMACPPYRPDLPRIPGPRDTPFGNPPTNARPKSCALGLCLFSPMSCSLYRFDLPPTPVPRHSLGYILIRTRAPQSRALFRISPFPQNPLAR